MKSVPTICHSKEMLLLRDEQLADCLHGKNISSQWGVKKLHVRKSERWGDGVVGSLTHATSQPAEVYSVFKLGGFESSDDSIWLSLLKIKWSPWRSEVCIGASLAMTRGFIASDATQIHLKGSNLESQPHPSQKRSGSTTILVSFNPENPQPWSRKLRFLLCRITIWFIILAFWYVVAHGYLQHGDVLRHQVGMGGWAFWLPAATA